MNTNQTVVNLKNEEWKQTNVSKSRNGTYKLKHFVSNHGRKKSRKEYTDGTVSEKLSKNRIKSDRVADLDGEEWSEVCEIVRDKYVSTTFVSNHGRLKMVKEWTGYGEIRPRTEKLRKAHPNNRGGYPAVNLATDEGQKSFTLGRLVAEHFLDDWDPDLTVDHLDGDKSNNHISNLEMVTQRENLRRYTQSPERCQHRADKAKAIAEEKKKRYIDRELPRIKRVQAIIDMRASGKSLREIGEKYGITDRGVHAIVNYHAPELIVKRGPDVPKEKCPRCGREWLPRKDFIRCPICKWTK